MARDLITQTGSEIVITHNNSLTFREQKKLRKQEKIVLNFAEKCAAMKIKSNMPLSDEQLLLLQKIHILAINCALAMPEVIHDPRKISYMANEELRIALAAILLTHALINHLSKAKYTKEFFKWNIEIYTNSEGTEKHIDFMETEENIVTAAIYDEVVYDWMIYRAPGGRGIKALSDEKTFSQGLENFYRGFSPISEFSRFERKLFEFRQKKLLEQKESAQQTFRNTIVQQVAQEAAKQLLQQNDPMELAKALFATTDYENAINQLLNNQQFSPEIGDIMRNPNNLLQLEDNTNKLTGDLTVKIPQKSHEKDSEITMEKMLTNMKMRDKARVRSR